MKRNLVFWIFALLTVLYGRPDLRAQDEDLESLLDQEMEEPIEYAYATFKSTRVLLGHSVERMRQGDLDARIAHRFGNIDSGWDDFFGLDQASTSFSLEYGIFDWLMVGVGRASYEKTFNGFTKVSLLRQCSGQRNMPVSISWYSNLFADSREFDNPDRDDDFSSRLSYVHQVLIARKWNPRFSLQVSPTWLHRNLVETPQEENDLFAVGLGGRFKFTNRVAFSAEFYYVDGIEHSAQPEFAHPIAVGLDIETGSHVFQIMCTNAFAIQENGLLTDTTANFWRGDIHLGFSISRVFTLRRP